MSGTSIVFPTLVMFTTDITAAISTTCAASGNPAAATSLAVASTTSYAFGDIILVDGGAGAQEFCRVAQVTDATHLLLDAPTQFAHNSVGHTVRNKAEVYQFWLDGGSQYECMLDYGAATAGDTATCIALMQTYDSDTAA